MTANVVSAVMADLADFNRFYPAEFQTVRTVSAFQEVAFLQYLQTTGSSFGIPGPDSRTRQVRSQILHFWLV